MKNSILIISAVVIIGVGGWLLFNAQDEHGHSNEHRDEYTEGILEPREPVRDDGEFTIVTSFYPLQFALEEIVGEQATVVNIGAGRDPHDYQPSTQDMLALQQADLVVLQGAMLEPWGEEVTEQLRAAGVPVAVVTSELSLLEGGHTDHDEHADEHGHEDDAQKGEPGHEEEYHEEEHGDEHQGESGHTEDEVHKDEHEDEHGHDHGEYDPHTWLDPVRFSETVAYLTKVVTAFDAEFSAEYTANAEILRSELTALDAQFTAALTNCTYDTAITSHDFLGYVADRYQVSFHSIAGLSTQDTPSTVTLGALREEAAEGVGAILLEENAIAAYGETLARETGLQTVIVNPVAFMVPEGENYLTLQVQNVASLATAFGCQ